MKLIIWISIFINIASCYLTPMMSLNPDIFIKKLDNKIKNAKWSHQDEIIIDSLLLNIYQYKYITFSRNSNMFHFKTNDVMSNLYVMEGKKVFKLSNSTKIKARYIRNYYMYEMDINQTVNGLLFNSLDQK